MIVCIKLLWYLEIQDFINQNTKYYPRFKKKWSKYLSHFNVETELRTLEDHPVSFPSYSASITRPRAHEPPHP
jgi:hypothetical protein